MVSLRAGGVGLNLVAASRLYLLDLWWNPAVEEQAIQRVHRIGQSTEVHVYKFVISNSIDEGVLGLQRLKAQHFERIITGEGSVDSGKLTLDDLKRLINRDPADLRQLRDELMVDEARSSTLTVDMKSSEAQQPDTLQEMQANANEIANLEPNARGSCESEACWDVLSGDAYA